VAVPLAAALLCALLLALLVLPTRAGTDLSAAVARADFARAHPLVPLDLRWYGGSGQFGYSLTSQYVMGLLGATLTGVLASIAAAGAAAVLLVRGGVRRPVLGSLAAAVSIAAGMVSGRATYALGLALGLWALVALRRSPALAGALVVLASATSPVAGLFAGLAGVALAVTGRRREGLLLAVAAAVPLALTGLLFGQGGGNTMRWHDAYTAGGLSLAVLVLVPHRVLRVGAALSLAGVLLALAVPSPVGLNATRLAVTFAVPLVLACVPWRLPLVALLAVGLVALQPPWSTHDVQRRGEAVTRAAFFAPLTAELTARLAARPARVEVVPTREYWEAAEVARVAPLARGWLRQLDVDRNPLFFDGTLSAQTYAAWLADNGVTYVALADAPLAFVGRPEGRLVADGLPYLTPVWRGGAWTLYAVAGVPSIAPGATVTALTAAAVRLRLDGPADVVVRVRWSRTLSLAGPGCLEPAGRWTRLRARAAGEYRVGSALRLRQSARC
jgi:hypothetical protein